MIMFQEGKELGRVPAIVQGKVQKFFFKEEDMVAAFDMNNLYQKCKEDKKFVPSEVKEANKESRCRFQFCSCSLSAAVTYCLFLWD